jgi:preprotein translocase subunit SecG
MLGFYYLLNLAAAATVAPAALPTPKPLPLAPAGNIFAPVSWGDEHPLILAAIKYTFLIASIALVVLMAVQTTKTEGLSGTIGGRAESAYRGRLGLSEQLARLTTFVAVAFIVLSILYFFITK